jgi:hypothetical protein
MKKILISILTDFTSLSKIIGNKWHLHIPIGIILGIISFWLFNPTFDGVPGWFKIFVSTFTVLWLSFAWEWCQGVFFGANKTENEVFESNKDIIVSTLSGLVGALVYYIWFLS